MRPPPPPTLFPYTTLFRSCRHPIRFPILVEPLGDPQRAGGGTVPLVPCTVLLLADAETGIGMDGFVAQVPKRSEEHTSELQSQSNLVCRLLLEKKKRQRHH